MTTQYDLTPVIAKHLDRHLVFPLLEFLGGRGLYDAADIEAAKLALIEKTNMVDYAVDIYQQLNQTDEVGAGPPAPVPRPLRCRRAGACQGPHYGLPHRQRQPGGSRALT